MFKYDMDPLALDKVNMDTLLNDLIIYIIYAMAK